MNRFMMTNKMSYHQNILCVTAEISGLFQYKSKGAKLEIPGCAIQSQYIILKSGILDINSYNITF